jgi:hypothetical protein
MKKAIEILERAKESMFLGMYYPAVELIKDSIADLKAPPIRKGEGERRVQCNWCGSVFDEEHLKVRDDIEYCPVCGDSECLMDLPEAESKPRWETPEQWEKRTGEKWPDNGAVYYRYSYDYKTYQEWRVGRHKNIVDSRADFETHNAGTHQIICATESGPPPDDWHPEELKT